MSNINICAPLTGTIIQTHVKTGQDVEPGELLMVLESMKVHVRVEAEISGTIENVLVAVGDNVERDATIITLHQKSKAQHSSSLKINTNSPHSEIDVLKQRQQKTLDPERREAQKKRHSKGYQTARENLAQLCDIKTFREYGQLAVAAQRQRVDYETLKLSTAADGIITGVGEVNQQDTVLIINDYSVLAGTQGYYHHLKLDRILDIASRENLPVIMFTEGGGGRPGDTDVTTVNSGLQCGSFGTWAGLTSVPRIAVANGYNFAGNAALFGAADITIATRKSWIGMAGPAMIEGGGLGSFKPTDIGPIDVQSANGTVDIVVENEQQACTVARQVLSFFQGSTDSFSSADQTALQAAMPSERRQTYAVREILIQVFDTDSFIELQANFGPSIIIGFARMAGAPVGIIANDCHHLGGAIDADAGQKATQFMELCDQFSIPMISFCDTPGFMVGPDHESQGAVRKLAKLFKAGAQLTTPFYAVILRKCYGLGAQAMLGGSTNHPSYTIAWPTGEFGPMGLEGAVKLGFRKELEAEQSLEKRETLFNELLTQQYARGKAIEVASVLEIDAVIDPAETRSTLTQLIKKN